MRRLAPEIIAVKPQRLQKVADRAKEVLDPQDAELIEQVFHSYEYLAGLVGQKNMSIQRLQALLFGAQTEKSARVLGEKTPTKNAAEEASSEVTSPSAESSSTAENSATVKAKRKGHGRHGAEDYPGAQRIEVRHESLQAGDACPECFKGTVYLKSPSVVVRITGQAPLGAKCYELQKLRCHLCGKVFTAALPEAAGEQKYDAQAASMIALLKYGSGMPFNRLQGLQGNLEVPLPASTQWDILQTYTLGALPVFDELLRQAAQGEVVYHDDTTVKILEQMGSRRNPTEDDSSRSGLYTSGVVSTREGRRIALFFSGRKHAGENLADVLQHRVAALDPPIQMCDALSRNMSVELQTILANCLSHARRKFVELHAHFPSECRQVLEAFKSIYHHDAEARRLQLSPVERLQFHQTHSGPIMTQLHTWIGQQFGERLVEPNSSLGTALKYLQKHWPPLTLFLRKAGAPLDNNLCERAMKKAILHRKNAYFYQTQNGAQIGDFYMSLIHTCELNQVNPFSYLTSLLLHPAEVTASPAAWLPWTYPSASSSSD